MNRILLYVDPADGDDYWQTLAWATDLAEAATFATESFESATVSLGVVAPLRSCLEIGLATLGRGDPRTVEQGERRRAPITLFPFAIPEEMSDTENIRRTLDTLLDLGAVEIVTRGSLLPRDGERPRDREIGEVMSVRAALDAAFESGRWEAIVVLGERASDDPFRQRDSVRIIRPMSSAEVSEDVEMVLRGFDTSSDEWTNIQRRATYSAIMFARLVDALQLE